MPAVVALIDDDCAALAALSGLVDALGYATRSFRDPVDFLACGAAQEVSALIIDMRLPGMNGLALHGRLRARGIRLPTLIVTAYPDPATRRLALAEGVDDVLGKPVSPDALAAFLAALAP